MIIECVDNSGFEDGLSNDRKYKVLATGVNGYLIENDNSQERWYGAVHFKMPGGEA
jgi:hypothetical protein